MIIDVHGHYTTEPPALHAFRDKQLAALADASRSAFFEGSGHQRRNAGGERATAAQVPERARRRPDRVLAACGRHGAPCGQREGEPGMVAHLQRPYPSHLPAAARQLRAGGAAAAVPGRIAEKLHPRARAHRERARLRRREPQPGPRGRNVDRSAAHRPSLVSAVREALRARRAGDDPRVVLLQPQLPPYRRALHQRRHHGVHAAHPGQPVQGFPDPALGDPTRRRRRAVPLGALSRPRAGHGTSRRSRSTC